MLINKVQRLFWYIVSWILRPFIKVHPNRILCWSYFGRKYSCNPYYITQFLLNNHPEEYEIYWCFEKGVDISAVPKEVTIVYRNTFKYCLLVNSVKFFITNCRTDRFSVEWIKKKSQRYIQTWHASMGLKKIEKDAGSILGKSYIRACKFDSHIADLILSGCSFRTQLIRRAFWYNGEILEKGTPRNDIFFDTSQQSWLKKQICEKYQIDINKKILLYAPTFRQDFSLKYYFLDWERILSTVRNKLGDDYVILVRLHPNFIHRKIDYSKLFTMTGMYDVTLYHDMQELLSVTDILITDYSSSMFDFSLLNRPCFIYAPDYKTYDRGTYFKLNDLPYPFAETEDQLVQNIALFNEVDYKQHLNQFLYTKIGSFENGKACDEIYKWMKNNI